MNIIIKNDNFEIVQDLKDNKSFTIFFNSLLENMSVNLIHVSICLYL